MEKHIYNEQTGISYTLYGDYYLPDLVLPDEEKSVEIGVWGAAILAIYQATSQSIIS